jgi:hypothetical protein
VPDNPQEVNVGLAADIGTLQRFPKIVGNDSKARELALTGRRFGAEEAREIQFVGDVVHGGRREVVGESVEVKSVTGDGHRDTGQGVGPRSSPVLKESSMPALTRQQGSRVDGL